MDRRARARRLLPLARRDRPPARRTPAIRQRAQRPCSGRRLSRHVVRDLADGSSEAIVLIDGVRCAACCWLIERTLGLLPGVVEVAVNAGAQRARIVYDGKARVARRESSMRSHASAIARCRSIARRSTTPRRRESRDAQKRLAVAGFGAMQAMMYASALWFGAFDGVDVATRDLFRWLTLLAATPVVFYAAAPFFAGAIRLLAARRLGMDVPVALAVALIYAGSVVEVVTRRPRRLVRVGQHVRVLPAASAATSKCARATAPATCPMRWRD